MNLRTRSGFTAIRSEGGLLPPDLLQRIAANDREVPGLKPEDYHLAPTERVNEAASRAWTRLTAAWAAFRAAVEKLPESDLATIPTRERFLHVLFQELGYGRPQPARAHELEGRTYAISHAWGHAPIHLIGCRVDLDRREKGVRGAATASPHGLVQELLNKSDAHLWAFLSNGLRLRILRDSAALTRQAYVEFDLEAIFEGEIYADFVLLWLLCHQSRVESEKPEDCWLERWSRLAQEQGTRALDGLRQGVEQAIAALGSGFLAHPANAKLKDRLRIGALATQDYYRQLLRLAYRLLFLFVAEDRDLLLDPNAKPDAKQRYLDHYSTQRLRGLAERRRGTKHADLWAGLQVVMRCLSSDDGGPGLALPALGSFLWSSEALPDLEGSQLSNRDLLLALRSLSILEQDHVRRSVDYKNLGPEELGSVYESLLELHPEVNADAATFELRTASGHERKTTGSYYTPSSLIECLLDTALDPVLDEATRKRTSEDAERAILSLKICDPACGSGHFLIAAAHRVARRLAGVRTGDGEPSPEATRTALRDVIGHCLYGIDMNPMAVELCKVSLWLEALEPGKPLSFLEHKIQCGNSLFGATPELIADGIPDDAFREIEGDDKKIASELRKRNRTERESKQLGLPFTEDALATAIESVDALDDASIAAIREKERRLRKLESSPELAKTRLVGDAWCAAFVWKKVRGTREVPTTEVVRRLARDPASVSREARDEIERLSRQYTFFHSHLAFPDVFIKRRGFDVVLGNPPWEHTELKEKEWFATRNPEIADAPTKAARVRLIEALAVDDPPLHAAFLDARRTHDALGHFAANSGRYPLCGRGRVNTYTIFAETMRSLISPTGRVGCIVPSGIATDDTTKFFFGSLVENQRIASLYEFENEGFFAGAGQGHMVRFCLLTTVGSGLRCTEAEFMFRGAATSDLSDPQRRFRFSADDIALLNPNTRTCPVFRTRRDAELTKSIYRRIPVLVREGPPEKNPWGISFKQGLFNMASDSQLFRTRAQLEADGWNLAGNVFVRGTERYLPLYEAKMVYQFDHRFGDYGLLAVGAGGHVLPDVPSNLSADPCYAPQPRYWVPAVEVDNALGDRCSRAWLLGWRDVTDSRASARTVIACVLPRVAVGHTTPLIFTGSRSVDGISAFYAGLNSFVFDYVARQKIGGTHLTYGYLNQLPALAPSAFEGPAAWATSTALGSWLMARVLELTFTARDVESFARDCGYDGPPFRWDEERRFLLRCELDAAFFHVYGIARDDVDYIMGTFPIVRRHDEKTHGEYRTKRVILEIYDALQNAIDTRGQYRTRLEPPPADPRVAHPAQSEKALSEAAAT